MTRPRDKLCAVAAFIIDSYRYDPELMKVIIVEVTRAANSFGRTHLPEIREAYDGIAGIVAEGQESGNFRTDIDPAFASMSFYGAIEQLLSGWIFELIPASDDDFDQLQDLVVATICDGLEARNSGLAGLLRPTERGWDSREHDLVKRLVYSGLLAATGALASIAAARASALLYRRIYNEDPPD